MTDKKKADSKMVYRILEEAKNEGSVSVGLFATGEPFLNKDLENYIKFAKKIGYEYIFINTNGAAATLKRMQNAIASGLDSIKFSINAGTKETYKKIHGKDDFERVIKNLFGDFPILIIWEHEILLSYKTVNSFCLIDYL